jgi:hypothetical protein
VSGRTWTPDDTPGVDTICAAVMATSEEDAKSRITGCHDDPTVTIEWRFCSERPAGWTPFGDRFRRADWMQWP